MSEIITRQGPANGDPDHLKEDKSANCVTFIMTSVKLENLLISNKDGDLGKLIGRARRMGQLTDILSSALPESDRNAIVAANVRDDGELVVICASSAWASRLRYETELLLNAAKDAGISAHTCRVRVSQG